MQYCVVRVQLDAQGHPNGVQWGPLDSHRPLAQTDELQESSVDPIVELLRRGKLVWAACQTPFGLAPGRLIGYERSEASERGVLQLGAGGRQPASWHDMPSY